MANAGLLTNKELEKLFRFFLSVGTKMTVSTRCLLRDFTEKALQEAFKECEQETLKRIREFSQVEGLAEGEEERLKSICNSYHVSVDYQFVPEDVLAFHNSLNPKITFGYSNVLHEKCTFALTDERKKYIDENISLDAFNGFYGAFYLGDYNGIFYEDTVLWIGEKLVFECVSHESMVDVYLDEETEKFIDKLTFLAGSRRGKH